jgi:hypothetical protein
VFDESIERLESENLSSRRENHLLHIFSTHVESSSADTSDDFILRIVRRTAGKTQFSEVLNTRHFVPGCTVVLRDLGFNEYHQ